MAEFQGLASASFFRIGLGGGFLFPTAIFSEYQHEF